jgi:WD40 repeat protein
MLRLQGVKRPVQALAFAPDGRTLASAGGDDHIHLWQHGTGKELARWAPAKDTIFALAYSPDGKLLASGGYYGGFHAWSAATHERVAQWRGGNPDVTAAAFSPDGKTLAVAFGDRLSFDRGGGVGLWDTTAWRLRAGLRCPPAQRHSTPLWTPRRCFPDEPDIPDVDYGAIQDVRWAPDGRSLLLATGTAGIVLWEPSGKGPPRALVRQENVRSLDLSADGNFIAAAGATRVELYDFASGDKRSTLKSHKKMVWSVAISPDGTLLLSCGADKRVRLWDLASGRAKAEWDWQLGNVNSVLFGPDGRSAVCGTQKGTAVVWDFDPKLVAAPAL